MYDFQDQVWVNQFIDAVREMRLRQVAYLQCRDRYNLIEAKRAEQVVDQLLSDLPLSF